MATYNGEVVCEDIYVKLGSKNQMLITLKEFEFSLCITSLGLYYHFQKIHERSKHFQYINTFIQNHIKKKKHKKK